MTRIRKIEKDKYKIYLSKAEEFYKIMKYAQGQELWIGSAFNGIHCAISICDALTTFYLGERSSSPKHEDVVLLLRIREDADYADFVKITKEDAQNQLANAKKFVKEADNAEDN